MSRRLHFQPVLDEVELRLACGAFFRCDPTHVFVYHDAVDILGSDTRDPDPVQKAAFDEADVRALLRRFEAGSGPIEGWVSFDTKAAVGFDNQALSEALAVRTGVTFYYPDPVPDPDEAAGAEAAQIEVAPDGATRHVWLSALSDAVGTLTIVSGRGDDEDDDD